MLDKVFDEYAQSIDLMLKELRKINSKGDLTKEELCMIKEIADTVNKMLIGMAMDEEGSGSYSEYYEDDMVSHARGRDANTGRYISRRGMSRRHSYDNMNVSRHSIEDRMVAALEDQMDYAKTDYEKQMVGNVINKIRAGEMK